MTDPNNDPVSLDDLFYVKSGGKWVLMGRQNVLNTYACVGIIWHKKYGVVCHGEGESVLLHYSQQHDDAERQSAKFVYFKIDDSAQLLNHILHNPEGAALLYNDTLSFDLMKKSEMN